MSSPIDSQVISATATALNDLEILLLDETAEPRRLPLSLVEAITNGFSKDREIGRGGFAAVYKGILGNGTVVAVKRLLDPYMDDVIFMREVECLMKAKHTNIVRFLGYCVESQGNVMSYNGKLVMAGAQQRLLCFEYLSKGSLRNYITDGSCKLEWRTCYQIIKGICQGLHYLHENHIVHLDLKPENVLLDDHLVPKIADFGLSRCFEENQTSQSITTNVGTLGYMAPELLNEKKITIKSDIYSLGIIIIEILTGKKRHPNVQDVLDSWKDRLVEYIQFEQLQICIDMGIECSDFYSANRPDTTQPIIIKLEETEPGDEVHGFVVHPRVLHIPCVLYLTNNTDEDVAFRLVETPKTPGTCCFGNLPLYGTVTPRSTFSLIMSTGTLKEKIIDLILESYTLGDGPTIKSIFLPRGLDGYTMMQGLFEKAKKVGTKMVQKVPLKAVATAQPDTTASKLITPQMKMLLDLRETRGDKAICLDVNPTKKWVLTGHKKGFFHIWNYQKKMKVHWCKVSNKTVKTVKFLERKKWFVVASDDHLIHVYNYETEVHKITSFSGGPVVAIHPSEPYLLSASNGRGCGLIVKLWDWDMDWVCTQILFEIDSCAWPSQVMFNPEDTDTSAAAFGSRNEVEVRTINTTRSHTLCGHSDRVNSLDFFTRDDQQFLITGSNGGNAKIWDMQKYVCIHTLQISQFPIISVLFHPDRQILTTGSIEGTVYLWSSTNYRLEGIINTGATSTWGDLWDLAYFEWSRGLLIIGQGSTIAMMDIENLNCKEESRHSSELQSIAVMRPGDTTTTPKIPTDNEPLESHPLGLGLSFVTRMLHLENKTDEPVAFRLLRNGQDSCTFNYWPECAIIPSRCTYTLVLRPKTRQDYRQNPKIDLILQSIVISGDKCVVPSDLSQCHKFFAGLIKKGNMVHEVEVRRALSDPHRVVTNQAALHRTTMYDKTRYYRTTPWYILDSHPTKTW